MWRVTAVGVDDDLATSQSRVALRTTSYEPSSRIDMELGIVIEKIARHRVLNHMLANLCSKLFVGNFRRMLRRNDDRIYAERPTIAIFNGYLRLAIRTKVGKLSG